MLCDNDIYWTRLEIATTRPLSKIDEKKNTLNQLNEGQQYQRLIYL